MKIKSNELNEKITEMQDKLLEVLTKEDVIVGASAVIALLIENAMTSKITKEFWLDDLSQAWDHYLKVFEEVKNEP